MVDQSAIQRDQLHSLDPALNEKHTVEWIPCCRLGRNKGERVVTRYVENFEVVGLQKVGKAIERNLWIELSQARFDSDLPKAGYADYPLGTR